MTDRPDEEIWTKRPGESTKNFALFRQYLELPPERRSLTRLASTVDLSHGRLKQLCREWHWVARVEAWTEAMAVSADTRRLEARTMIERGVANEVAAMLDEPAAPELLNRGQRVLTLRRARLALGIADSPVDATGNQMSLEQFDSILDAADVDIDADGDEDESEI